MRDPVNIQDISLLSPDFMGFIFYPPSSRFAGDLSQARIADLPASIKKVGVFVNIPTEAVLSRCRQMGIRMVQLHGDESPDYCKAMQDNDMEVIKAFGVGKNDDLKHISSYQNACDYYLLDTASKEFGGTGKQFDWEHLDEYVEEKPFFLSGGIGPEDAERIAELKHPNLFGVDLNSRFETKPGIKNRDELAGFMQKVRAYETKT
ncbi:phosphoribosylanthranilate isomerase [Bacteroidota bacterium]